MRFRLVWILAALLALPSCSGPVIINDYQGGIIHFFQYAASGRDLRAVIVGTLFNEPKAVSDARVINAMQGRFGGVVTNLTTTPSANSRPQARLYVILDHFVGLHAASLCRNPNPELVPRYSAPDRMRALLAFCEGDTLYAEAQGSIPRPASAWDRSVDQLLSSLASVLIPQDDVHLRNGDNEIFR